MRVFLLFALLNLNIFGCLAQAKHALVVAIGDYPTYSNADLNWSDLSSLNDVELLRELFKKQEFLNKNTTVLLNEKANATRLHAVFDSITNTLKTGDVFFFHFSGHGQQVADFKPSDFPAVKYLKRDEADGLDETLVLYNAPLKNYEGYNFAEHFYDDQLNYYLTKIQEKIGPTGQVIVVIDACHSGTATRGAEDIVVRGSKVTMVPAGYKIEENSQDASLGFDADLNFKSEGSLAPMVAFFGCKAEQVNREIRDRNGKGYGSLTYFFTKSFYELKDQASFQNLFSKINEKMILQFRSEQNPVFEGTNLNSKIFNGDLIIQEPFFDLIKLLPQIATINGGQLNGLQVGDSIGFYPNTTTDIKSIKPIFKGVITNLGVQESNVQLLTTYTGRNDEYVKYRAFNINPVNQSNLIILKLNMQSKSLKKDAQKFFDDQKDVELVESNFNYLIVDTLIHGQSFIRVYIGNNQTNALRDMPFRKIVSTSSWDSLLTDIRQSVRADVFRKLEL
ncbi:MAG: caspase family protein, partial [Bacteroidota bacterium]